MFVAAALNWVFSLHCDVTEKYRNNYSRLANYDL
jgi:hypothetical protein